MIPFIVAGVAIAAAGTAIYKYATKDTPPSKPAQNPNVIKLGKFAIWGQPEAGKTTFIARLRGQPVDGIKEQTTSVKRYGQFTIPGDDGKQYQIEEMCDLPGTKDRLDDWLELVETSNHLFYVINLAHMDDEKYQVALKNDIEKTLDKIKTCSGFHTKKLHLIGTHLDESKWSEVEIAKANNEVANSEELRSAREYIQENAGYVYSVNLLKEKDSRRLVLDLINDCRR